MMVVLQDGGQAVAPAAAASAAAASGGGQTLQEANRQELQGFTNGRVQQLLATPHQLMQQGANPYLFRNGYSFNSARQAEAAEQQRAAPGRTTSQLPPLRLLPLAVLGVLRRACWSCA